MKVESILKARMREHPGCTTGRNERHQARASSSLRQGMGYLLCLASLIILMTNVAKDIASINASNTLISLTPLQGDLAAHPPDSVVQPNYTILCLSL